MPRSANVCPRNRVRYTLNSAAIRMADRLGAMADLDPIWRDHPDILDAKVNVSPMILYGLTLC